MSVLETTASLSLAADWDQAVQEALASKLQRLATQLSKCNLTPAQTRIVLLRTASNHLSSIRIDRMANELAKAFAEQRETVSWLR